MTEEVEQEQSTPEASTALPDIDKAVQKAVAERDEQIAKLSAEVKLAQEQFKQATMSAEELAKEREKEARNQAKEEKEALLRENRRYFTRDLLRANGMPVSDSIVDAYTALPNEAIKDSIEAQAKAIADEKERLLDERAARARPSVRQSPSASDPGDGLLMF